MRELSEAETVTQRPGGGERRVQETQDERPAEATPMQM